MGGEGYDCAGTRDLFQMEHQRLSDALSSKLCCDEEMVDVSGLLQIRKSGDVTIYFNHPRLV